MGGSPRPRPRPPEPASPQTAAETATGGGAGVGLPVSRPEKETSGAERTYGCPSDFAAEVADIPRGMEAAAADLTSGSELQIELRGEPEDPAFLLEGEIVGWLAVNIEEVTECLRRGWRYGAVVKRNEASAGGRLIIAQVYGSGPGS